jgi:hypothetical protein
MLRRNRTLSPTGSIPLGRYPRIHQSRRKRSFSGRMLPDMSQSASEILSLSAPSRASAPLALCFCFTQNVRLYFFFISLSCREVSTAYHSRARRRPITEREGRIMELLPKPLPSVIVHSCTVYGFCILSIPFMISRWSRGRSADGFDISQPNPKSSVSFHLDTEYGCRAKRSREFGWF